MARQDSRVGSRVHDARRSWYKHGMRLQTFLLPLALCACQKPNEPAPAAATPANEPAPSAQLAPSAQPGLPPGHPSPAAPSAAPASAGELGPAHAGGLAWSTEAPLVRRAPKSSMRAAEYGVEGDA